MSRSRFRALVLPAALFAVAALDAGAVAPSAVSGAGSSSNSPPSGLSSAETGGGAQRIGSQGAPAGGAEVSLSVSNDISLSPTSSLYKGGELFLWDDDELNLALGRSALTSPTAGFGNVAIGPNALSDGALTSSSYSTAVGADALRSANSALYNNTAVGAGALEFLESDANDNTALGRRALWAFQGDADGNTALGSQAGQWQLGGSDNTVIGHRAMLNANNDTRTPNHNTAVGVQALYDIDAGTANTAIGVSALRNTTSATALDLTVGSLNVGVGYRALESNTVGASSVAIGAYALNDATGGSNTALGARAGESVTDGVFNILIGADVSGNAADNYTIRIGSTQARTFVAGIFDQVPGPDATAVYVGSNGKLGTGGVMSTRRRKTEIEDLGERSRGLLDLRPVSFRYLEDDPDGGEPKRWGLIAEEVVEVFPEIVQLDAEGLPAGVRYHQLVTLLLNELQRQEETLARQEDALGIVIERADARARRHERELAALREELRRVSAAVESTGRRERAAKAIAKSSP